MDYETVLKNYLSAIDAGMRHAFNSDNDAYRAAFVDDKQRIRVKPSGASIIVPITDTYSNLIGKCHRECYFDFFKVPQSNPVDSKGLRRMDCGKTLEKREHDYANAAPGITVVQHNLRMKAPLIEDITISMEFDTLAKDVSDNLFIDEIKTFYGYDAAKEIFGSKDTPPKPKGQHLLQVMSYIYAMEINGTPVKYAIIHYIDRGDFEQGAFVIELVTEGEDAYPVVNGVVWRDYSLRKLIARYTQLGLSLKNKTLPPRDAEILYSDRKIEALHDVGLVSDFKFKEWQKGKRQIGDFQCSYCNYKNLCWGPTPNQRDTWKTDDQIAAELSGGIITPTTKPTDAGDGW